jgi:predicted Zn-dependent protease with MMP-like domain
MINVSQDDFEQLVADGLDAVPEELFDQIENVAVVVEEWPEGQDKGLLGEYVGYPLGERYDYSAVMPDMIKIYRQPILRMCETREQVVEEVTVTVVHEIAHYFGIDDARLHELGWG